MRGGIDSLADKIQLVDINSFIHIQGSNIGGQGSSGGRGGSGGFLGGLVGGSRWNKE